MYYAYIADNTNVSASFNPLSFLTLQGWVSYVISNRSWLNITASQFRRPSHRKRLLMRFSLRSSAVMKPFINIHRAYNFCHIIMIRVTRYYITTFTQIHTFISVSHSSTGNSKSTDHLWYEENFAFLVNLTTILHPQALTSHHFQIRTRSNHTVWPFQVTSDLSSR